MIQDYDFTTLKAGKKLKHLTDYVRQLVFDAFLKTGKDPEIGTNLSQYFVEAGVGNPDGTDASSFILPFKEAATIMRDGMQSMVPALLKLGLATFKELDHFFKQLNTSAIEEKNVFVLWFMLNSAWKKKLG